MVSILFLFLSSATVVIAGDFGWIPDFNRRAEADLPGFRASLSARFNIGAVQIDATLTNIPSPVDAYMIFHLGEMSGKPVDYVLNRAMIYTPAAMKVKVKNKAGDFDKGKDANMGSNNDIERVKGKGKNK